MSLMDAGNRVREHRVSPSPPIRRPRSPILRPAELLAAVGPGATVSRSAGAAAAGGHGAATATSRVRGPLRRSREVRVVAGVCGGLSQATGIDVTVLRIAVVLLALGSGIGVLVYAVGWLLVPLEGEQTTILTRAVNDRRGIRLVIALVPVLFVVQILSGSRHIHYLGSISWPLFLAAAVAILIVRNASDDERGWISDDLMPMLHVGTRPHRRWSTLARILVGLAVGIGGLLLVVLGHPTGALLGPVVGCVLVVAAMVVLFGPWWLGLIRDLLAERQARALAEERAQMAAHVHDSVLQTLALIQRSADDPQHVVRLARAQERELRSWLFDGRPPGTVGEDGSTLSEGIEVIQRQIEADHGVTIQVVVVGDCPLSDPQRALLDAAREATVNAAKWSGASQIAIFAEVDAASVMIYVRDRGRGFDPTAVGDDHKGIAHSIRARVARFGGSAVIHSAPGEGTEVELSMPRRVPAA